MSKGNVHLKYYLFDEPGVEAVVEELDAIIDDIVYSSQAENEAVRMYRMDMLPVLTAHRGFGTGDSEPESEVCEQIATRIGEKFRLSPIAVDELYEELRYNS